MYELFSEIPLFMGDSEIDQINKIFEFWGTPQQNQQNKLEITNLPFFKQTVFPNFKPGYQHYSQRYSKYMSQDAFSLLLKLLEIEPSKRISAKSAIFNYFILLKGALNEQFFGNIDFGVLKYTQ